MTIVLAIGFTAFYLIASSKVNRIDTPALADISVQSSAIADEPTEVPIVPTQQPVEIDDSDALTAEAMYQSSLVELSKLTIRELKALCKGSGIKNYSRLTKAQLLAALA